MVSGAMGSGAPLSVIWGPPDSSPVSSRSPVCLMRGLGAPSRWQNFLERRLAEIQLRRIPGPRTPVNRLQERRHISGGGIMVTTMSLRIRFLSFVRPGRSGSVRMLSVAGHSAKHLENHPEIAQGVEVGDLDPAVLTAEHQAILALRPRHGPVEVRVATATWCTPSHSSASTRA